MHLSLKRLERNGEISKQHVKFWQPT